MSDHKRHPTNGAYRIIECAQAHGEQSEPEHEIADLHSALIACFETMTTEQRKAVLKRWEVKEVLTWKP